MYVTRYVELPISPVDPTISAFRGGIKDSLVLL
jgi:hypothetical protein